VLPELVELRVLLHDAKVILLLALSDLSLLGLSLVHLLEQNGTELLLFHFFHLDFLQVVVHHWLLLLGSHRGSSRLSKFRGVCLKFILHGLVCQRDRVSVIIQLPLKADIVNRL
jgi:hypothetical protein